MGIVLSPVGADGVGRAVVGGHGSRMYGDRAEGGRALAEALERSGLVRTAQAQGRPVVVLAIPRGGLPVGAEVAAALGAELDVVVV
ncbi:MAG: hypothetical protein ACRDU8_10755, partial [Egibacteraceae bacterium]